MNGTRIILLAGAALSCAAAAKPLVFTPPPEDIPARFAGADAEIIQLHCVSCHSLDYLATQPPGKGLPFWRDAVNKMINVYGAPIAPEDVERIAAAIDRSDPK